MSARQGFRQWPVKKIKNKAQITVEHYCQFIFDLGYNYSVTHIHLYQFVFLMRITKYRKMLVLSIEIEQTLMLRGFREQSKCYKGLHSNKKVENTGVLYEAVSNDCSIEIQCVRVFVCMYFTNLSLAV